MKSHSISQCCILLAVIVQSFSASVQRDGKSQQTRHMYEPASKMREEQNQDYYYYGNHPPSTIQVGNIAVQTGQNWSFTIGDYVTVKRKPGGGVEVIIQPPENLFGITRNNQGAGVKPDSVTVGVPRESSTADRPTNLQSSSPIYGKPKPL